MSADREEQIAKIRNCVWMQCGIQYTKDPGLLERARALGSGAPLTPELDLASGWKAQGFANHILAVQSGVVIIIPWY
jgi:hypothetical protein